MIRQDYYKNGQIASEIPCTKEGETHGIRKTWYANGQLMYEYPFHRGLLHGILKYWWEDGQLHCKSYYLYGKEVTEEEHRYHELMIALGGL